MSTESEPKTELVMTRWGKKELKQLEALRLLPKYRFLKLAALIRVLTMEHPDLQKKR